MERSAVIWGYTPPYEKSEKSWSVERCGKKVKKKPPLAIPLPNVYCCVMLPTTSVHGTALSRKVLTTLIDLSGEDTVLDLVLEMSANRGGLRKIAETLGVSYVVLFEWLDAEPSRMSAYRSGLRARADTLVHDSLDEAEKPEGSKFKAEHLLKVAGKWDAGTYGDVKQKGFEGGVSFTIVIGSTHPELERPVLGHT